MKVPNKIQVRKDLIQADLPLRKKVNEIIEFLWEKDLMRQRILKKLKVFKEKK